MTNDPVPPPPPQHPPAVEPVAAHELVATTLRNWVQLGIYTPEQRLPPERELAEQMGVGRVTLRTAIRQLNAERLLRTTRGRGGGTFVVGRPTRGRPRRLPDGYIEDVRENYEFRLQIEPLVARLAAERGTAEQRGQLVAEASHRAETVATFRANDSRVHMLLAEMCGNRYAAEAIQRTRTGLFLWIDSMWDQLTEQARVSEREHMAIALAVLHEDGAEAERLMTLHLQDGAQAATRSLPPLTRGRRPR